MISESNSNKEQDEVIYSLLAQAIKNRLEKKMNSIFVLASVPTDERSNGLIIFRSTCIACHGADGEGIQYLAPPLNGSEYVGGSTDRLAMIILNGLTGPIQVKNQLYKFNGSMPAFASNFSDEQIADIIDYLYNSFVPEHKGTVTAEKIKAIRNKKTGTLMEKDLFEMPGSKH